MGRPAKVLKPYRAPASPVALTPADIVHRYRISNWSRLRWEREGRLPKRDFFIGGKAVGWLTETILKMEAGDSAA
jgi:hypothetical protein